VLYVYDFAYQVQSRDKGYCIAKYQCFADFFSLSPHLQKGFYKAKLQASNLYLNIPFLNMSRLFYNYLIHNFCQRFFSDCSLLNIC